MSKGWIKLHRTMLQWEHFKEGSVLKVFLALLCNADRDGKTDIKLDELMENTGMSHNTVNMAIAKLVKSGEITREKRGQNIYTTISNWSKYQENSSTQNLGEYNDSLTQKVGECENPSTQKVGECNDSLTQNLKAIHPKNGTTIYNKNNNKKDNKNVVVEDARARVIDNLKTYDFWAENMCKNYHLTHEELCAKVDEFVLDMACSDKKIEELINARAYFNAWLSNNLNRNNGNNQRNNGNGNSADTSPDAFARYFAAKELERRAAQGAGNVS